MSKLLLIRNILVLLTVIAFCIGVGLFIHFYAPILCEDDPSFCESEPQRTYNPLIPVGGLALGAAIILGIIGLIAKWRKK